MKNFCVGLTAFAFLLALASPAALFAQDQVAQGEVPPPPPIPEPEPLPPKVQDPDEQIQPQVVIRQKDGNQIEEYSTNGMVYMIRVVPEVGPAYFLIDTTGDGDFDSRFQHDQANPVHPAHWKLIEW